MFQYAFGLAAAQLLSTELVFPDETLRSIFVLGPHSSDWAARPTRVVTIGNDDYARPEQVIELLTDDTTYVGFFQSEQFFTAAAEQVRVAFRPTPDHERAFELRYGELAEHGYVCCHMRRTDYETFAGGVALPMTYYRDSLRRLNPPPRTPIVFIGDDLVEARATFGGIANVRFEHNDEALDLQLLTHADAVVASNSTFAWWGGWLGNRNRRVLTPRYWIGVNFGWEYPPGVIPADWLQIPVRRPWRRRLSPTHLRMSVGRARRTVGARIAARRGGR